MPAPTNEYLVSTLLSVLCYLGVFLKVLVLWIWCLPNSACQLLWRRTQAQDLWCSTLGTPLFRLISRLNGLSATQFSNSLRLAKNSALSFALQRKTCSKIFLEAPLFYYWLWRTKWIKDCPFLFAPVSVCSLLFQNWRVEVCSLILLSRLFRQFSHLMVLLLLYRRLWKVFYFALTQFNLLSSLILLGFCLPKLWIEAFYLSLLSQ